MIDQVNPKIEKTEKKKNGKTENILSKTDVVRIA